MAPSSGGDCSCAYEIKLRRSLLRMRQQTENGVLFLMAKKQRQIEDATTIVVAGFRFPLMARARGCSAVFSSILQWFYDFDKRRSAYFAWARRDVQRLQPLGAPSSCCWINGADFGFLNWVDERGMGGDDATHCVASETDLACDILPSSAPAAETAEDARLPQVPLVQNAFLDVSEDAQGTPEPCCCVFEATLDEEFLYYAQQTMGDAAGNSQESRAAQATAATFISTSAGAALLPPLLL